MKHRHISARSVEYGDVRVFTPEHRAYARLAQGIVLQAMRDLFEGLPVVSLEAFLWFMSGEAEHLLRLSGVEPPPGGALYGLLRSRRRELYVRRLASSHEEMDMSRWAASLCVGNELRKAINGERLDAEEYQVFIRLLEYRISDLIAEARQQVQAGREEARARRKNESPPRSRRKGRKEHVATERAEATA